MHFNIAYTGPETFFHLRRDFILAMKYSLEALGHDVVLSGANIDTQRFNLIIGAYFLEKAAMKKIAECGARFAHVNTEIIGGDMLNFNPDKVNFMGDYLPSMKAGEFVWDVVLDNLTEHARYGVNAHFLRWGYLPELQDIRHRQPKDLDFYFFGSMSDRRKKLIKPLVAGGLIGAADSTCPYFLRNDRISRAKVHLNLIQADQYTHVNSFRICYLANNACCIISEHEQDPANYLEYAETIAVEKLEETIRHFLAADRWKARGEKALADFSRQPMRESMEKLLDASFGSGRV